MGRSRSSSASSSSSDSSSSDSEQKDQKVALTEEDEQPAKEATPQEILTVEAPTLSRSWSVRTAHVPIFTGGKLTHSRTSRGLETVVEGGTNGDDKGSTTLPFLLLPVGGDVALVDAHRGIQLGTVRGLLLDGVSGNDDHDDDQDAEGVDADAITAYALAWNDKMIVTCSHNSILRLYSVGAVAVSRSSSSGETDKDKRGGGDSSVHRQETTTRLIKLTKTWGKSGHTLPVTQLEFHCSNIFVATGSVDGSVRIWDVRAGHVTHVFRPQLTGYQGGGSGTLAVTALNWLPDVATLQVAIARDDGSIAIHNLRDSEQEQVVVLRDHVSSVTCMEWNENGSFFVTSGRDAVVNLWRCSTFRPSSKKSKTKTKGENLEVAFKYERLHTLPIYEQVEGMVLLPTTKSRTDLVVATCGSKGRIRLWIASSSESTPRLKLLSEQPESEAFGEVRGGYMSLRYSPAGASEENGKGFEREQLIVADAEHNVTFLLIDDQKQDTFTSKRTIVGHNDDILDLKVIPSPSGEASRIVVATNSARVRLFDLNNFSCDVLDRHSATVLCVDVSPCGRYIATCGKDKQMRIWHLGRQVSVAVAIGHTEAIGSTAFSRKVGRFEVRGKAARNGGGAFAVTVSMDRTLKRWNLPGAGDLDKLAENEEEASLTAFVSTRAHDKDINIVSVAPNDSYIATGSQDKSVKLWRPVDLSLVATLKGHRRGVWDCQFSPFDRVVATGSGDMTVKLWSLSDFSCVRTFQGHVASVLRVRFLSGGLQLVSSGADGLVKLWTIRTNECETTMDRHSDKVWALDLAGNGKSLVSGGADSQLIVWEDTTKQVEAAKQAEEEEAILLDQKLANHMRHNEYGEALEISLARDKPHQTLKVLTAIVENDLQKGSDGLESLKHYASQWSADHLVRVLKYCREWNTRARNSTVALLTIKAIVTSFPADELASTDGVPEILAGIVPYAERHFDRIDRLCASSYLLDFVLFSMGSIHEDKQGETFSTWQSTSRLVLPPKQIDGRAQIGGSAVVGLSYPRLSARNESDDEIVTIGDSDSSDDDKDIED